MTRVPRISGIMGDTGCENVVKIDQIDLQNVDIWKEMKSSVLLKEKRSQKQWVGAIPAGDKGVKFKPGGV